MVIRLVIAAALALAPAPALASSDAAECIDRWRARAYLAHAADAATTVAAIESGRAREGNPLARALFGRNVTSGEFLLFKAGTVAAGEAMNRIAIAQGDLAGACRSYRLTAIIIGGMAMINLRVHF